MTLDTDEVVEAYKEHGSTRAAAKELGCANPTVSYHLQKSDQDVASHNTINRDRVVRLYREGLSMSKVARALGCSTDSVSRICRERGVETRDGGREPWLKLPVEDLLDDWRDGMSISDMAEKYECSKRTIRKRIGDHA